MKTIYMVNIPFHSTEKDVRVLFAKYGSVESVKVIITKEMGRSRGFGFVEMEDEATEPKFPVDHLPGPFAYSVYSIL